MEDNKDLEQLEKDKEFEKSITDQATEFAKLIGKTLIEKLNILDEALTDASKSFNETLDKHNKKEDCDDTKKD